MQRRGAAVVRTVHISAGAEQPIKRTGLGATRDNVKRRVAKAVARVDVDAAHIDETAASPERTHVCSGVPRVVSRSSTHNDAAIKQRMAVVLDAAK